MARLFLAIQIPESAKRSITHELETDAQLSEIIKHNSRPIPGENWHITVLFLGDQSEDAIPAIKQIVQNAIRRIPAPTITFDTLTTAPPEHPPHMLWATITPASSAVITPIKDSIEQAFEQNGIRFKRDFPQFNGHSTVARDVSSQPYKKLMAIDPFPASSIELIRSTLTPSGSKYETIAKMDFKSAV